MPGYRHNLPDVSMKLGYQGVFKTILERKHLISVASFRLMELGLSLLRKKPKTICQRYLIAIFLCCASEEYSHRIFNRRPQI